MDGHTHVTLTYGTTPLGSAPLAFALTRDDGVSALIQSDVARVRLAETLGWQVPEHLDPDHDDDVSATIDAATQWLHDHEDHRFLVPDDELVGCYEWLNRYGERVE